MLFILGYPDQAAARSREALATDAGPSHLYTTAFARVWSCLLWQFGRDHRLVHERAEMPALAGEKGFPFWLAIGTVVRGWMLVDREQIADGIAQIRQGLADYRATGSELFVPYFISYWPAPP